jgi:acetolactate synthase-1/2/3 large subunit
VSTDFGILRKRMRTIDLIADWLRHEGTRYLFCFPTTAVIEACAQAGLKPIICRQERVGVGIADGFSRATDGATPGVFAMQYGPGAENAYGGIATAFSDSVPILLLPLGHPLDRHGVAPLFTAHDGFRSVAKRIEVITSPGRTPEAMRRAYAALRLGHRGPVVVEIPADVAVQDVPPDMPGWQAVRGAVSSGDPADVLAAARALCSARRPVVLAGQGVLYARASDELVALADLLCLPVATTLLGKSAFPETHPLALGCASQVTTQTAAEFIGRADLIVTVGSSLTRHATTATLPPGVPIVQITDDPSDLHKDYAIEHAILGDARLVLRELADACRDIVGRGGKPDPSVAEEIRAIHDRWFKAWLPTLTHTGRPINPYRVIHEFSQAFDPAECVVTHDSGNPRGQIVPFYRCAGPRSYLGWGMSHGLGTSLGLIMGAKLACPDKTCVNFMGDAAFGTVGLDFETAVRHDIPILTLVLNNSGMASEVRDMPYAEAHYGASNLGGDCAAVAQALGGYAERVTDTAEIKPALLRAHRVTQEGRPALVEFITAREMALSTRETPVPAA